MENSFLRYFQDVEISPSDISSIGSTMRDAVNKYSMLEFAMLNFRDSPYRLELKDILYKYNFQVRVPCSHFFFESLYTINKNIIGFKKSTEIWGLYRFCNADCIKTLNCVA